MNDDWTDLRFRPDTHVRSKHPDAGGNDVVHLPLLEISAGVLPHQLDDEIPREHLSVVRMAAEVEINTRIRKLPQFLWLVVEDDDGLILVHVRCDLIGRLSRLNAAAGTVRVGTSVEVEFSVDERALSFVSLWRKVKPASTGSSMSWLP